MTLNTILYTVLIGPLELAYEIVYQISYRLIGNPGLAIILLSLLVNVLVLPLYKRADAIQEAERQIQEKMRPGVTHIKKSFKGDERMMMLQTYYRQNNYKPLSVISSATSLLLQIPFFIAAYNFLSHLALLNETPFGPIADLGKPDALIHVAGLTINALPVLMTLINMVSTIIFTKGHPLKSKLQLYGMALFFLVFLYESPAGLVFYWTLNNLFSLIKTIFYKIPNPRAVLAVLLSLSGLALGVGGVAAAQLPGLNTRMAMVAVGVLLQLPALLALLRRKASSRPKAEPQPSPGVFTAGSIFLTVLVGLLIPSTFIAASPQEYVDAAMFYHPLWYILISLLMAVGTFLVWMRMFYWLADRSGKAMFDKAVWVLCGVMLMNYMFFGTNLGIISPSLQYETGMYFDAVQVIANLAAIAALAALLLLLGHKLPRLRSGVLSVAMLAFAVMSAFNMVSIKSSVDQLYIGDGSDTPHFQLSTTGQNVIVLMLDRGLGEYIPYFFNEKPELEAQFAGFTYYSNTISHGNYTNFGTPAVFGGYEYTPVEMNRRDTEPLWQKQNEALSVMPLLFSNNGYQVTVCDPPYANYHYSPDPSIYQQYEGINAYNTESYFGDPAVKAKFIANNKRNFFCFSLMKTLPLCVQPSVYALGSYNQDTSDATQLYTGQILDTTSVAHGLSPLTMNSYNALTNLTTMTQITTDKTNNFLMMANNLTHEPMLLQLPDYTIAPEVDNTSFEPEFPSRTAWDGAKITLATAPQKTHYQTQLRALMEVGRWLDYLRELGVYDNTRIIIAADHGRHLMQFDQLIVQNSALKLSDLEFYYPLLMVKDFNSTEFTVSDDFMTNADVPTLTTDGVIQNPVNPFTGKPINNHEKLAHDQYVIMSWDWSTANNNGNTFRPARWAKVHDDLWNTKNWEFYLHETVLKDYAFPKD